MDPATCLAGVRKLLPTQRNQIELVGQSNRTKFDLVKLVKLGLGSRLPKPNLTGYPKDNVTAELPLQIRAFRSRRSSVTGPVSIIMETPLPFSDFPCQKTGKSFLGADFACQKTARSAIFNLQIRTRNVRNFAYLSSRETRAPSRTAAVFGVRLCANVCHGECVRPVDTPLRGLSAYGRRSAAGAK